jgi:hypothetical protein
MKTRNPIGAAVQVCSIITLGRLAQRPKYLSFPSKAIISGFGLLLVFGLSGLVHGLPAQQFKPDKATSKQETPEVLLSGSASAKGALPNESSLIKRIALLPIRLGRSVANALFPRAVSAPNSLGNDSQEAINYPKLIYAELPLYPRVAWSSHITGTVEIQVTVVRGSVVGVQVKASSSPFLTNPTVANVKRWKFESGSHTTFPVTYVYAIEGKQTPVPENPRLELDLPRVVRITARPFKPTCSDCP